MLLDFALFVFLLFWWGKRKFAWENTFLSFALYAAIRFFVEFFRLNTPDMMYGSLTLAQWASIVIFVVFMAAVLIKRARITDGKVLEPVRVEHESGAGY
jgi:phosphatidylglycerol:prolipoprotein diacylglycerol transferase